MVSYVRHILLAQELKFHFLLSDLCNIAHVWRYVQKCAILKKFTDYGVRTVLGSHDRHIHYVAPSFNHSDSDWCMPTYCSDMSTEPSMAAVSKESAATCHHHYIKSFVVCRSVCVRGGHRK